MRADGQTWHPHYVFSSRITWEECICIKQVTPILRQISLQILPSAYVKAGSKRQLLWKITSANLIGFNNSMRLSWYELNTVSVTKKKSTDLRWVIITFCVRDVSCHILRALSSSVRLNSFRSHPCLPALFPFRLLIFLTDANLEYARSAQRYFHTDLTITDNTFL